MENNKQETLEEAAEIILFDNTGMLVENHPTIKQSMLDLAKWQQERMYSEEDLRKAIALSRKSDYIKDWSGGIQALDKYDENEIIDIIKKEKQKGRWQKRDLYLPIPHYTQGLKHRQKESSRYIHRHTLMDG